MQWRVTEARTQTFPSKRLSTWEVGACAQPQEGLKGTRGKEGSTLGDRGYPSQPGLSLLELHSAPANCCHRTPYLRNRLSRMLPLPQRLQLHSEVPSQACPDPCCPEVLSTSILLWLLEDPSPSGEHGLSRSHGLLTKPAVKQVFTETWPQAKAWKWTNEVRFHPYFKVLVSALGGREWWGSRKPCAVAGATGWVGEEGFWPRCSEQSLRNQPKQGAAQWLMRRRKACWAGLDLEMWRFVHHWVVNYLKCSKGARGGGREGWGNANTGVLYQRASTSHTCSLYFKWNLSLTEILNSVPQLHQAHSSAQQLHTASRTTLLDNAGHTTRHHWTALMTLDREGVSGAKLGI